MRAVLLTCFRLSSNASFRFLDSSTSIETVVIEALTELASTTPTILGPFALTYIIFAGTITWPLIYFLQVNNFLTSWFRLGVINRILKGG